MVVVTGANGHIGCNLVRALLQGREVRAVVRSDDPPSLRGLPVERVRADVRDRRSLDAAFRGAEVVYHLAAVISITGDRCGLVWATNVEGTRHVAAAAKACGVRRLVHCSSCHAFDAEAAPGRRVTEASPRPSPRHPAYDRSKAAGEAEIRAAAAGGLDAVIVNPTSVVGPNDFGPSRMGQLLLDLRDGRLPASVGGGFDWVDVRDVVRSAIAAETAGRSGENYLLGGHFLPLRELLERAGRACGVRPPRLVAPMWLARLAAPAATAWERLFGREPLFTAEGMRALRSGASYCSAKAARELGHRPRPIEETLEATYASFRDIGL